MKNTIIACIVAISMIFTFTLVSGCTDECITIEFTAPEETSGEAQDVSDEVNEFEAILSATASKDTYEYLEDVWLHADWIDVHKFYNSYVDFLGKALNSYKDGTIDVQQFKKMLYVYAITAECLIGEDETMYSKIVYDSCHYKVHNERGDFIFDEVYAEMVEAEFQVLSTLQSDKDYPFVSPW